MASIPQYFIPSLMEGGAINHYLDTHSTFMPAPGYYSKLENRDVRRLAVSVIAKHWRRQNNDAFVPYLAVNYFDRFASRNPNSDDEVPLVAISCLTLALKMRINSFSLDMIPRHIYDYEPNAIKGMEIRILDGLEWQMRPVTPFSFLNHIYPTFLSIGAIKRHCINQIIVQAQGENKYIGRNPYDFAFTCFLAAIAVWDRRKLPSKEILGEESRLHLDLAQFCLSKNIRIECAKRKKTFSSKASSSSAAGVTLQGPSVGPSSSAAGVTLQGPSVGASSSAAAASETEPDQKIPEGPDTFERIAAADIGTESGQQRPEGTETSERIAVADIGTVSGQQRPEGTETSEGITATDIGKESGQHRSDWMETSEGIAAADIGTKSTQQRPEGTETTEGIAAADIRTESGQQRLEGTETSEGIAAADIGTESGQQRLEGMETSEGNAAADIGTESGQQRPEGTEVSEGIIAADIGTELGQPSPEVAEISEEFVDAETGPVLGQQGLEALPRPPEDVPPETEAEKQRRLERGKRVCEIVEAEEEDEWDYFEQFFQKMMERVETSNQGIVPAAEAEAPRRLMDFDLTWPTDDPFIGEPNIPTLRVPTIESLSIELERLDQDKGYCGCCNT